MTSTVLGTTENFWPTTWNDPVWETQICKNRKVKVEGINVFLSVPLRCFNGDVKEKVTSI